MVCFPQFQLKSRLICEEKRLGIESYNNEGALFPGQEVVKNAFFSLLTSANVCIIEKNTADEIQRKNTKTVLS